MLSAVPLGSSPISTAVLPSPAAFCLQHLVCRAGRTVQRCSAEHQSGALHVKLQSAPLPLHAQQNAFPTLHPFQRHKAVAPCIIPTAVLFCSPQTHQTTSQGRMRSRKAASTSSCARFPCTAFRLGAPRNSGCCWDRSWVQLCSTAELMCLVGVQVPELTRCWGGFQVRSCALVQDGEVEFA